VWRRRRRAEEAPWLLRTRDGRLVAELHDPSPDWPWTNARVRPGPAWEEAQPLFADDDGVLPGAVTLTDPDGQQVADFLLHVDGDTAWWR